MRQTANRNLAYTERLRLRIAGDGSLKYVTSPTMKKSLLVCLVGAIPEAQVDRAVPYYWLRIRLVEKCNRANAKETIGLVV